MLGSVLFNYANDILNYRTLSSLSSIAQDLGSGSSNTQNLGAGSSNSQNIGSGSSNTQKRGAEPQDGAKKRKATSNRLDTYLDKLIKNPPKPVDFLAQIPPPSSSSLFLSSCEESLESMDKKTRLACQIGILQSILHHMDPK